jgi:tRNA nucleotidyltransferase (CCA-adding enzyme)
MLQGTSEIIWTICSGRGYCEGHAGYVNTALGTDMEVSGPVLVDPRCGAGTSVKRRLVKTPQKSSKFNPLQYTAILSQYASFLKHLEALNILDADTFKPVVKGTDLAKAMNLKPGPWMKDALEVVMAWQLRNPDITDPAQAIEEVKKIRKGELTSRLLSRFLSLTIRPLFVQTEQNAFAMTDKSRSKTKTWRDTENAYVVDLLGWCLRTATEADVKREFHLLRVPILQMLDSAELRWKAQACSFISLFVKVAPKDLIMKHGYKQLFADDLFQLFTYLPTLTPESDAVLVFDHAFPALLTLSQLEERTDEAMLDRVIREGVLAPFFHLTSPSSYPALSTTILTHLSAVLSTLSLSSVTHLPTLLPALLSILRDPFIPASPNLLVAAAKALQSVISNGWPRIDTARLMDISTAICEAWIACAGYDSSAGVEEAKQELKKVMSLVDRRVQDLGDDAEDLWIKEKRKLVDKRSIFGELFGGSE